MEREDWKEIMQVVQKRLTDLGRKDLADVKQYRKMYKRKLKSSRYAYEPIEKYIVLNMLGAIYTDLYAGSPNLLNASMRNIRKIIKEGNRPSKVYIQINDDESYTSLTGSREVSDALSSLRTMIRDIRDSDRQEKRK